ncbi:hypothetical protein SAMN04487765_0350 [Tenacibaculum sp. MAR_2010_89]|uniref:hypothetical protein n=1 Tax=Tenacibaculum sp. MAR_2010_89 TaxID=1250198 RepID=UPI0008973E5B|nr:hypothetical protein [Tenacibaculum sp. MAR_2010_89]SED55756.1 hypothetical protein SAMN04487765_0350 [Tenacibaculum sp. MAR_2010_89]
MKKFSILFLSLFVFISCNQSLKLVSATKQTVFPGRPTEKAFTNYILKFSVDYSTQIEIDSIKILQNDKSHITTKYLLKHENASSYSKSISEKGSYTIEIPLKNINTLSTSSNNSILLYLKEMGKLKEFKISKFKNEEKRKR